MRHDALVRVTAIYEHERHGRRSWEVWAEYRSERRQSPSALPQDVSWTSSMSLVAWTRDPFLADTLRTARDTRGLAWVGWRDGGRFGAQLESAELADSPAR